MPFVVYNYQRGEVKLGLGPEEIEYVADKLLQARTPVLNYHVDFLSSFYPKEPNWLSLHTHLGDIVAPYTVLFDYSDSKIGKEWGIVDVVEPFEFPKELNTHRKRMVARFEKKKKLGKGNRPCPRVCAVDIKPHLRLTIQKAFYFDQVGTNLTLDAPLRPSIKMGRTDCLTVRKWDVVQTKSRKALPRFEASKLANTIGVSVGITVPDDAGHLHILQRKRTKRTAVYERQWHVPFSFALDWPETLEVGSRISLSELIKPDYGFEFAEEMKGMEITDFEPARLLALCRDIVRGGKPQFFIDLRSRIPIKEILKRIKADGTEYSSKTKVHKKADDRISPELLAFSMLVNRKQTT